jgi:hypothetical protein
VSMLKKSVCNDLRNSPRVNKDLLLGPSTRLPIADMAARKEESMHISWTGAVRTAQMIMHELQLSLRALMPAAPAVVLISPSGKRRSHLVQPVRNRVNRRRMGELCLQGSAAAADGQGARAAGFGGYDVTDTKFSIRLGPPSCSPPV